MDGSDYLDEEGVVVTKSPAEYGRLYGGTKKQRTTTPFLGKENPRRKMTTPVFTSK